LGSPQPAQACRESGQDAQKHLNGLLAHFEYPITNAVSDEINSKIQSIKATARGFLNFANYRIRILFTSGKLDLTPDLAH
jgi:transposase